MALSRIHDEPDPVMVVRAWCNAAGPAMARAVFPRGYEGGRLEVVVPDRAWLRELESRREELMQRLRHEKRMHQLREISFVLELSQENREEMAPRPRRESNPLELIPEILSAARAIADEDLSRRWTAAISRLLGASPTFRPGR
jgi:Dna[CI] antecedent DciA-like protein